ncbi:THO complex subunit 1 transcription elongation factor-domain-containing protein [Lactarius akahatsu]|uniref:THO complex subunit 1 transcription elongation factor-domain-containing protein n=1 Tax=Lactarius akahatsu TaxID=416441 RepID=A0AAD4Q8P1_9AGAM|nr:THO complex subunit 1 transcription elongation factor-domain-containing protein [Lactarius akahatsu]
MDHRSPDAAIRYLLQSLPPRPFHKDELDKLVSEVLQDTPSKFSLDVRRGQWELALKSEIFALAMKEGKALGDPESTYYDELKERLELVLTFTEQDACEQAFPFSILQDLLETQTITSCSHIFSWIESRATRLTVSMAKGKALILLRTLNDLLRRLSKMGSNTIFCGRILTFLSGVFPLGERSGVNLRGEYGPTWETVLFPREKGSGDDITEARAEAKPEDAMAVDESLAEKPTAASKLTAETIEKKEDLYNTFWSLQLPFSKPAQFALPQTFNEFQDAVNKILPVIKEATAKERALTGSRTVMTGAATANPLKRKRESEPAAEPATAGKDYFFAKFLTSPDLLDLEIADTHFRRQFLFQLLVLLHHLQTFTKEAKATWVTPRNRSLQMEFTLEGDAIQWVSDTIARAFEELRQTAPAGRVFADAVAGVLERERKWVRWKSDLCSPFDREPQPGPNLEESTRSKREGMRKDPEEWSHSLGSAPLTEIWEMGYRDLGDLENPFQPGDVKDFVKKIKLEDNRIEMRKKILARQAERVAAARAKAAATSASTPNTQENAPESTKSSTSPSTPTPVVGSPLHPSLPAKPGPRSPTKAPENGQAPLTPSPAPTPTPPAPAAAMTPAAPERVATPAPAPIPTPPDEQITKLEENKQRWAWLALRTARDQHLAQFAKIGTGDIVALAAEIEREREAQNAALERGEAQHRHGKKRVLVTGAAGYIGSHVVFALQQTRRYKVVSIDNYYNSYPKALKRLEEIARNALPADATELEKESTVIDKYTCDLTSPADVRAVFEQYGKGGFWGVVHVAAYKAVGESSEIPVTYYHNNVTATIYLLQVMSEFDCSRLVYSSSATVYGDPPKVPIPETTRLKADSPYGRSKVMCEAVIEDLMHAEPTRWRAISLRYFNPAGAHPSGLIGEDPRGRPGNLLPLLAHMAVGRVNESTLQVFGDDYPTPDGTCVRDYLHVLDLASGHLLALDALAPGSTVFDNCPTPAQYKAYNLGRGQGFSVLQILEAMRAATKFNYTYNIIGRRRGDVPDLTADPSLAEKELGFRAKQDLTTMCRDLWNWQTKNPTGYGLD